jgi:hypothetical protein
LSKPAQIKQAREFIARIDDATDPTRSYFVFLENADAARTASMVRMFLRCARWMGGNNELPLLVDGSDGLLYIRVTEGEAKYILNFIRRLDRSAENP